MTNCYNNYVFCYNSWQLLKNNKKKNITVANCYNNYVFCYNIWQLLKTIMCKWPYRRHSHFNGIAPAHLSLSRVTSRSTFQIDRYFSSNEDRVKGGGLCNWMPLNFSFAVICSTVPCDASYSEHILALMFRLPKYLLLLKYQGPSTPSR